MPHTQGILHKNPILARDLSGADSGSCAPRAALRTHIFLLKWTNKAAAANRIAAAAFVSGCDPP